MGKTSPITRYKSKLMSSIINSPELIALVNDSYIEDGEIIDATVDQFGDDYSIYSSSLYKNLYREESEDYTPLVFDDWMEYIDNLFEDKERMNLTLEE